MIQRWKDWTEEFLKHKVERTFTPEQGSFLFKLALLEKNEIGDDEVDGECEDDFLYQVLKKRANYYNLKISPYAILAVCIISNQPGDVVMWCHALKRDQVDNGKTITVLRLCELFPLGFPDKERLCELWDKQKIGGDNFLDLISCEEINESL